MSAQEQPAAVVAVAILATAVVLGAVVVRLAHLGDQSYWTDEAFSVNQAAGSLHHLLTVGRTEIHTPLYALLLGAWIRIGETATAWTHCLSAILGLLAVSVSFTGLRRVGLSASARSAAVAGTATCGVAIVYSQETRPYGLVLLAATGVASAATQTHAALLDARPLPWAPWLGWGLLAASAHLLGAVLVVGVTGMLVGLALRRGRGRDARHLALLAGLALVPQVGWLAWGITVPGFASGTAWIPAPRPSDVLDVLTSVFSAGHLEHRAGFAWTSPLGVVAVLLLALAGLAVRLRGRTDKVSGGVPAPVYACASPPSGGEAAASGPERDGRLAAVQLAVAFGTIAMTFAVAQVVHIWTLRNMVVVAPSLTWGTVWALLALPRSDRAARVIAVLVLAGMAASVAATEVGLRQPYKTDWRAAILLLARMRQQYPEATFTFFRGTPAGLYVAADRDPYDLYVQRIGARTTVFGGVPPSGFPALRRVPGPQAVLYYPGLKDRVDPSLTARILQRLGDPSCRPVPVYGLVLVTCPGTTAVTAR